MKRIKTQSGTKEWAPISMNLISGCIHNCRYCYGKASQVHYKHLQAENWEHEKVRFNLLTRNVGKRKKLIMYPSIHDIHPIHIEHHIYYLRKILQSKNNVLIVSKPHLICIERICNEFEAYKSQIIFRFTIGSNDNEVLKFWEINSPPFEERLESLKLCHRLGFQTSVSCEPLLDPHPDKLINCLIPFVTDSIWIGRANLFSRRSSLNGWKDDETKQRIKELKKWMDDYDFMYSIYLRHRENPLIRWKDSLRRQLGIQQNQFSSSVEIKKS